MPKPIKIQNAKIKMTNQNSKLVKCQNCSQNFQIEPEDFQFYEKIQVPPPTFCPECRMIRRMSWRNERTLYKRKCGLCGQNIISMYDPNTPFKVYCVPCWWSDKWEATKYGKDYDFSKSFFVQFYDLLKIVPFPSLQHINNVNSDYTNNAGRNKNAYFSFSITDNENIFYCSSVDKNKDCIDCAFLQNSELCYQNIDGSNNYNCFYLFHSSHCLESYFLFDCQNCKNCFMSANLRNKQFILFNQQLAKEEYFKKIQEIEFGGFANLTTFINEYLRLIQKSLHKFARLSKTTNCVGDNTSNSKNAYYVFNTYGSEEIKYSVRGIRLKDSYDIYGGVDSELIYEGFATGYSNNKMLFFGFGGNMQDSNYTYWCHNSSHLFGCIGLRHKQYCILNKQYTKEEYEKLVPKIIEHMNEMPYISKSQSSKLKSQNHNSNFKTEEILKSQQLQTVNYEPRTITYRYGEFFPPELSPFAYNETIAQEYFPLTKDEALAKGCNWKEPEERNYQITMKTEALPDNIKDVPDSIVDEIIGCANYKSQVSSSQFSNCTQAFRIIKPELDFYRRMNLPLPRLCPNCRHYERIKQRNPLKLWHRKCQCVGKQSEPRIMNQELWAYQNTAEHFHGENHCPNEFETSYAPERKEIVYCEKCYQEEVV